MREIILIGICAIALAAGGNVEYHDNGHCPTDYTLELLLPHGTYCNKFYQCTHGNLVEHVCAASLVFSYEKQECTWPKFVNCGGLGIYGNGEEENQDNTDEGDWDSNDNKSDEDNGNGSCNCNPSEAPTICAAEHSNGVLVAHEYCNKFYKCNYGLPVELSCPSNLYWNTATDQCDWAENVDCGDRITCKNCNSGEGDNGSNGNNENGNGDNENDGGNDNNNNGDGNDNINGGGNCNPSEAPTICAAENSNGVLVAHEYCNKFYKCNYGLPVQLSCPSNLYWNTATDQCDWAENVDCGDRIACENCNGGEGDNGSNGNNDNGNGDNENDGGNDNNNNGDGNDNINGGGNWNPSEAPTICAAENSNGVLVAHEYCNKFYKCSYGLPVALSCPSNLYWNTATDQCDWAENVDCGDRIACENCNGGEGDNDSNGNNDNDNDGANDNNNIGDGNDNINGGGNCNPSEAPTICAAENSNGVLVAHEHCNKFYKCSYGLPVALSCPSNLYWNTATDQCDWAENVDCGDRIACENCNGGEGDNGSNGNNDNGNGDNENDGGNDNNNNGDGNDNINVGGNCNPSEAPTICAAENSNGVLVAHEYCNKFYKCNYGLPVQLSCPSNLYWNTATDQCDWAENVDCGDRIACENCNGGAGDNGSNGNNENGNGNNENDGGDDNNNNGDGNDNINGGGNCNPSEAPTICAAENSNGVLVAHEYCNKFYKCNYGLPVELNCPSNLYWNTATDQCDWAENVDCGDRIACENCNGGAGDNGSNGNNENGNGNNENDGGDDNNNNGDGNDNINGGGNCNPSEAPTICAAENSNGVLVAHEYCNKFYKCNYGLPVELNCPSNLYWNTATDQCDWAENVDCGDRIACENCNGGEGDNGNNGNNDNGNGDNENDGGNDNNNNVDGNDNINGGGNCNPSEAPTICAAENSNGVLVAHEYCNKFYKCNYGLPVQLSCPSNLYWNTATDQCDWAENVDCGDRIACENCNGGEGDNGSNGNNDNGNGDNENDGGNDNNNNGDGNDNINGGGNWNPSEAPTICAAENSNGVLVAHEYCNKFYKCSYGLPVALSCPSNLYWNTATDQCDWAENVDCGDRIACENCNGGEGDNGSNGNNDNDNDGANDNNNIGDGNDNINGGGNCNPSEAPTICAAENSNGVLVAHEHCNKFYKCSYGLPVALSCPSNLYWNTATDQCDWAENVDCGDRIACENCNGGEGDNGSNGNNDNGNGDNENDGGNDNNNNGDGNDNINVGGNCNPSEAPTICAAENSNGVLIAHEYCNKFYKCSYGLPVAFSCPSNLYWNTVTDQCDWAENVDCGDRLLLSQILHTLLR